MKFKNVVKLGFSEMLNLKENWLIGCKGQAHPKLINKFIEYMLIMLNPIVPHFCQHVWETVFLPAHTSCGLQAPALLIEYTWPQNVQVGSDSFSISQQYGFLKDTKSKIREAHSKASTGGKKPKKAKGAEPAEAKAKGTAVLFVRNSYPEYKMRVLKVLTDVGFADGQMQGDHITRLRDEFKDNKKEGGLAMKFAAFVIDQAKENGPEVAFAVQMPFDQEHALREGQDFLFENMPSITAVEVFNVDSPEAAAVPEGSNALGNAEPGKPSVHFY